MKDLDIWKRIEELHREHKILAPDSVHKKHHEYSIIAHSTRIEGSTLTDDEAYILLEYGSTSSAKPLRDYEMNADLQRAYERASTIKEKDFFLSPTLLQELNSLVVRNTADLIINGPNGTFYPPLGQYRLLSVSAGYYGRSFMNYAKIPKKVEGLCHDINEAYSQASTLKEIYELSFEAHYRLVDIHPWVDGNGRTSRLLMNLIQQSKGVIPSIVISNDKAEYIASLKSADEQEMSKPFIEFMTIQLYTQLKMAVNTLREKNTPLDIEEGEANEYHHKVKR